MIHDMIYLRYMEMADQSNLQRIRDGIAYSVERSSLIVANSQFPKGEIVELLNITAERIVVIPAAVSLPEVTGDATCYANPLSVENAAEGIYRILSDEAFARRLTGVRKIHCSRFN